MTDQSWVKAAEKSLKGRTIVAVRWLTQQEADDLGWGSRAPVLVLDDGNMVYPSADDEGNDAGALFLNSGATKTLPVFR
jgi:hypothetical protein